MACAKSSQVISGLPSAVLTAAPASCSLALAVGSEAGDEVGDFDFGDEGGGVHQLVPFSLSSLIVLV